MGEVTIRETADADGAQAFLDHFWEQLDPEPWLMSRITLVAERDGQAVGVARGSFDAGVAHLGELMVADGHRGGGIGARLLAAFEAWAAACGAHKLTLHTAQDRPAVPFYERHGWRVAYVMENHYQHRTFLLMTKAITGNSGESDG